MIKESQEKYLATHPDGEVVIIKPFDPQIRIIAENIIGTLRKNLPDLEIFFGGAAALEIAGQNDIDINILATVEEYDIYSPIINSIFGEPYRRGSSSITWKFVISDFDVDLHLANKNSPIIQEQIKVFSILSQNKKLKEEYERVKLPYGPIDYKEYMRKKYTFFNKVLGYA
ncbi:MAG: GrpB family protein [Minisyncoccota bacterium]